MHASLKGRTCCKHIVNQQNMLGGDSLFINEGENPFGILKTFVNTLAGLCRIFDTADKALRIDGFLQYSSKSLGNAGALVVTSFTQFVDMQWHRHQQVHGSKVRSRQ